GIGAFKYVKSRRTLKTCMLVASAHKSFSPNERVRLFAMIVPYNFFSGCVVIKRDLWLNREKDRYIGSEFIHVGVIFQAPLPGGSRVLARPGITIRYGNALWSPRAVEIWVKKWSEVLRSLDCIPETLIREKAWQWSVASLKRVVVWRAVGAYSFGTFRSLMSGRSIPLWESRRGRRGVASRGACELSSACVLQGLSKRGLADDLRLI